jgi:hypothetical protein
MKFSLLAVTAVHFGTCVNASPIAESTDKVEVDGWWEDSPPPGLETRSGASGKKFTLAEVENPSYKPAGAPVDLLRTFYKYNKTPPKKLQKAVGSKAGAEGEHLSPLITSIAIV